MRTMRTKIPLITGAAALLGIVLAATAGATAIAVTGATTQLTTNPGQQADAVISGDVVAWTDFRNGNYDIFFRRLGESEVQITSSPDTQWLSDVSGETIVYGHIIPPTEDAPAAEVIRAYDVATGVTSLVATPANERARLPSIDGTRVVYEVCSEGAADIWTTDLTTGAHEPVTATPLVEASPAVSGARVVYDRRDGPTPRDVVLFDLATAQETVLAGSAEDERVAEIDGDVVVWETSAEVGGERDIAVHDLSTGATTRLVRPGDQFYARVSGDVVTFMETEADGSGADVLLYHIPTRTTHPVAVDASAIELVSEIDGGRIVYTGNAAGGAHDIWLYEFDVELPEVDVAPGSYEFGDVAVGSSASTIVTVSNVGQQPLVVSSIVLAPSGGAFAITSAPSLPSTVAPGATIDVQLAFSPTAAGAQSASLVIGSDDLDEASVDISLAGTGVLVAALPETQIADILEFFDDAVAAGTLAGSGAGKSGPGRLGALRNMLEAAGDLIRDGEVAEACDQLADARDRADGAPQPPDFVAGAAAAELVARIDALRGSLECA